MLLLAPSEKQPEDLGSPQVHIENVQSQKHPVDSDSLAPPTTPKVLESSGSKAFQGGAKISSINNFLTSQMQTHPHRRA